MFGDYKWGDKFKVSRVSYEDGIQNYKFGNETANTVYINQNNMYIVDSNQVENIYNQIKDLEVYSFEGETIIDPAYDIGDILIVEGKPIIYQGELEYQSKFKANIKSKIQAKTEQESMQTKENETTKIRRIQSEINQIDGEITQLIEENSETSNKLTQVEQTIDGISQKVESIQDVTNTVEGIKTIILENCMAGDLLELHIYGNNTVFDYLYPRDDLYPSDDLYPYGDSRIVVNDTVYELGITEVLRQNGEVCDEFILENGQAKVIRRVNKSGSTKAKEKVEDLGELKIPLHEGTNTIKIKNYTARLNAKFAIKNDYTNMFATKVEMNSSITQTANEIKSEVKKKVDEDEIISRINQSAEQISIEAEKISLNGKTLNLEDDMAIVSKNFNVDKDGNMSCTNANITGGTIKIDSNSRDGKVIISNDTINSYSSLHPSFIDIQTNGQGYAQYMGGYIGLYEYNNAPESTHISYNSAVINGSVLAKSFENISLAEHKKNFEKLKNGLDIIRSTEIYKYNLKSQNDGDKKHIGFVIGKDYKHSKEITALDKENKEVGVDLYSMVSVAYKAIQEQQEIIEKLQEKIQELEAKQ